MKVVILEVAGREPINFSDKAGYPSGNRFAVQFRCSQVVGRATFVTYGRSATPPKVGQKYSVETDYTHVTLLDIANRDVQASVVPAECDGDYDIVGHVVLKFEHDIVEVVVGEFEVGEDQSIRIPEHSFPVTLETSEAQSRNLKLGDLVFFRLHELLLFDQGY